jgi:hypothetical protein
VHQALEREVDLLKLGRLQGQAKAIRAMLGFTSDVISEIDEALKGKAADETTTTQRGS